MISQALHAELANLCAIEAGYTFITNPHSERSAEIQLSHEIDPSHEERLALREMSHRNRRTAERAGWLFEYATTLPECIELLTIRRRPCEVRVLVGYLGIASHDPAGAARLLLDLAADARREGNPRLDRAKALEWAALALLRQ